MASRLQPAAQKSQGVGKRVPSLKGLGINQRRCPSTHVLGYACAALRAGFVKILYLSLSRDVQGSPLPRDLACFRDATDDLTGAPDSRRFCAAWGGSKATRYATAPAQSTHNIVA